MPGSNHEKLVRQQFMQNSGHFLCIPSFVIDSDGGPGPHRLDSRYHTMHTRDVIRMSGPILGIHHDLLGLMPLSRLPQLGQVARSYTNIGFDERTKRGDFASRCLQSGLRSCPSITSGWRRSVLLKRWTYAVLASAIAQAKMGESGEVPSFALNWLPE